jgi:Cu/Ag efflux protein CusF
MKWPAMTTAFQVADKALLDKLEPGATVQFEFREQSRGKHDATSVKR